MASIAFKDKSKDKKKKKDKGKAKAISNEFVEDSGVDEPPSKAYKPPEGSTLLQNYLETEEFDYDTLKDNDDLELWAIRVPEAVKPKHFENARISLPSSSNSEVVGTLSRKHVDYDIWSVRDEGSDQTSIVGGGELLGLNCLVPRKRKAGKLYIAPIPITRHLVLAAQPTLPTPLPSDPNIPVTGPYKGPERYRHPSHLLKHRFLPSGTVIDPLDAPLAEIVIDNSKWKAPAAPENPSPKSAKEGRLEKKRKGDTESSKKKKIKSAS